ncbi:MAG: enoyl-CoA hydratase/isomerase family protein [Alphaproteobacteria bacterium]|nr:enoyl-CoA hydratase/isomerase family protein [Alphaproteobacteria bacterium]
MKLNTEKMIAEKADGIGTMIFNNPARRNAMSLEMWEAINTILEDFENDDDVRVVVMKGAGGKAFVSGADISEFKEKRNNAEAAAHYAAVSEGARDRLGTLKKPLIAMIDGFCLGGGLAVALAADMRFASEQSQFGVPAARLGIAYAFDGLRRLVSLVGPAIANEIMFTANRIDAKEALRTGLINRVIPGDELEATVRALAITIANNAPLSVNASKVTIKEVLKDSEDRDMDNLVRISKECFDSADYAEGRQAFMEKREAVFTGT